MAFSNGGKLEILSMSVAKKEVLSKCYLQVLVSVLLLVGDLCSAHHYINTITMN
jgi:hypothetical protein